MSDKPDTKKIVKNTANVFFVAALILLIFSPGAKAWFLKQLLSAGLFKAEISKGKVSATSPTFNFSYQDERGNVLASGDLKGKVVFMNFWATWCPPCRAEMSSLNTLYSQLKNDNRLVFLFLNEDDNVDKAKLFLKENNYQLPMARRAGVIPDAIFGGTLPTTVVLDKEGRVVMKHEGMADYNHADFIAQLKSLL